MNVPDRRAPNSGSAFQSAVLLQSILRTASPSSSNSRRSKTHNPLITGHLNTDGGSDSQARRIVANQAFAPPRLKSAPGIPGTTSNLDGSIFSISQPFAKAA